MTDEVSPAEFRALLAQERRRGQRSKYGVRQDELGRLLRTVDGEVKGHPSRYFSLRMRLFLYWHPEVVCRVVGSDDVFDIEGR